MVDSVHTQTGSVELNSTDRVSSLKQKREEEFHTYYIIQQRHVVEGGNNFLSPTRGFNSTQAGHLSSRARWDRGNLALNDNVSSRSRVYNYFEAKLIHPIESYSTSDAG